MSAVRFFEKFQKLLDVDWANIADGQYLKRTGTLINGAEAGEGQVWRGEYNPATAYQVNDAVSYQGSTFICVQASTGNAPVPDTASNIIPPLANTGSRGAIAALPPSNQALYYARGDNTWQLFHPVGSIVQSKYLEINSAAVGTPIIPVDETIPQIGEGTQIGAQSFTPLFSNSLVRIRVAGESTGSVAGWSTVAIFRGAVADSIAYQASYTNAVGGSMPYVFESYDSPATISAITYIVRAGPAAVWTQTFGKYAKPGLTITFEEIKQ